MDETRLILAALLFLTFGAYTSAQETIPENRGVYLVSPFKSKSKDAL